MNLMLVLITMLDHTNIKKIRESQLSDSLILLIMTFEK